jgi:hypothetical protein
MERDVKAAQRQIERIKAFVNGFLRPRFAESLKPEDIDAALPAFWQLVDMGFDIDTACEAVMVHPTDTDAQLRFCTG